MLNERPVLDSPSKLSGTFTQTSFCWMAIFNWWMFSLKPFERQTLLIYFWHVENVCWCSNLSTVCLKYFKIGHTIDLIFGTTIVCLRTSQNIWNTGLFYEVFSGTSCTLQAEKYSGHSALIPQMQNSWPFIGNPWFIKWTLMTLKHHTACLLAYTGC